MGRMVVLSFLCFVCLYSQTALGNDHCNDECDPPTFDVVVPGHNATVFVDDAVAARRDSGGGLLGFGTTTQVWTKDGRRVTVERGFFGRIWSVDVD